MNENKNKKKNWKDYVTPLNILLAGGIFTLVAPLLLTINTSCDFLNFTNTGAIGDTIGGITAPIVNLTGAILVYFALRSQIKANEIIQDQFNEQKKEDKSRKNIAYISGQIELIIREISDFSFSFTRKKTNITENFSFRGADAIYSLLSELKHIEYDNTIYNNIVYPKQTELQHLLFMICSTIIAIERKDINKEDKNYFLQILGYHFFSKIKPSFDIHLQQDKNNNNKTKKVPDELISFVNTINTALLFTSFEKN